MVTFRVLVRQRLQIVIVAVVILLVGDTLITKTKSVKSAVWKYFGYKDEAAMKEETTLCQICCI